MAKNNNNSNSSSSISFGSLLAILFIALKLTGVIDWPWAWVLAPLWIGLALIVLFFVILFVVAVITGIGGKRR